MSKDKKVCDRCSHFKRELPMSGICLLKGTEQIRIFKMRYESACSRFEETQYETIKHIQL